MRLLMEFSGDLVQSAVETGGYVARATHRYSTSGTWLHFTALCGPESNDRTEYTASSSEIQLYGPPDARYGRVVLTLVRIR